MADTKPGATAPNAGGEEDAPVNLAARLLASLGDLRDGLLVLTAVIYLLGYLAWGMYASWLGVGALPAIDAQYILAGVTPFAALVVTVLLVRLLLRLMRWADSPASEERTKWAKRLGSVGLASIIASFVLHFVMRHPSTIRDGVFSTLYGVGGFGLYGAAIVGGGEGGDKILRWFGFATLWILIVATPVVILTWYGEKIFPNIPQELGGPAPRCVTLDLDASTLADSSLARLVDSGAHDTSAVRRSRQLDLLFDASQFVVVTPRDATRGRRRWTRLHSEAITAEWQCEGS